MIKARKSLAAFGRSTPEFLERKNPKILAYRRIYEDEILLIVNNLSRYARPVELCLKKYEGMEPVELWGNVKFPKTGERPCFLTPGPHGFYGFRLNQHSGNK